MAQARFCVTAIFSEKNEKIQSDNEKIYFNYFCNLRLDGQY